MTKSMPAFEMIGRGEELRKLGACIQAGKNVLLEGPVGVGKTHLALAVTREMDRPVFRIDGDNRYTEQKLSGWFDPPTVIKKGFSAESFVPGPLVDAMKSGGVLFINELNRLPEGVQNVLLPAIDERMILVPKLGEIRAKAGFIVIATQNPKEFVATSHLSEAILDRFELVVMDYQSEADETEIVSQRLGEGAGGKGKGKPQQHLQKLPTFAVRLARMTRDHPRIRRGASVRAALSLSQIATVLMSEGMDFEKAFVEAAVMAFPTRIEIERESDSEKGFYLEVEALVRELSQVALSEGGSEGLKKKELMEGKPPPPASRFESSLKRSTFKKDLDSQVMFLPPEAFGQSMSLSEDDVFVELTSASDWDVATRYHEFKSLPAVKRDQKLSDHIRRISADAVLERARAVLGSVVHPVEFREAPWNELPADAEQPDIDIDETLENSPLAVMSDAPLSNADIWMSYHVPRRQSVVLSVDTSLSMTGEKLALTAVALAVVLLQFPYDPIGILAFENESKILKKPEERISIQQLVERFLDVPAQGYTHLEEGMRGALQLVRTHVASAKGKPPSTVLLTDGKYTAGKDPAYLASRFPHLVVLKMGSEKASLSLCQEMARKGRGALREVAELEELPDVMYGVVKDLLRGRSNS